MNERIRRYFDEIEAMLIESPAILSYQIIGKDISLDDGKLRLRSALSAGGLLECFVYINDKGNRINTLKYSFHWQDAQGRLIRRLDNAPHHAELPNAPHHLHIGADKVEGFPGKPDFFSFIEEIERHMTKASH